MLALTFRLPHTYPLPFRKPFPFILYACIVYGIVASLLCAPYPAQFCLACVRRCCMRVCVLREHSEHFVEQMRSKQAAWAPIRRRCSAVAEFASQLSSSAACTCVHFEFSFEMVASAAFPSVALSYSMPVYGRCYTSTHYAPSWRAALREHRKNALHTRPLIPIRTRTANRL